ncbi:MAG TPA: 2Fe-2S iron-sulfur cluster-binding protein [Rhizomicrobium sp.]|jgi:ring-1,2-phenylacetyl-CoA epoxidase subunit PaaE|nr:2Fe-2S iron-sulfur cluster-binding protein [Rhizomicrobium sp.]
MSLNREFHALTIAEVRRETQDAISVRFDIPERLREVFAFQAGQHLTLRMMLDGEDVRRNYSVCVAPAENEIRIAIKQMPAGKFSAWANANLREGRTIDVLPPLGNFVLPQTDDPAPYYIGLAGGSGITPVIAILKTALATKPESRFTLLYGNRDTASIMFLEELAALKNRYLARFEIYHFLEFEAEEIELFNGRLDRAKCEEVFSQLVDVKSADAVFICGPGPMMDAAEAGLRARAVANDRIFIERFTTSAPSAEQLARAEALQQKAAGRGLVVTLDGRKKRILFDADKGNILENVQASGLPAPYACKSGVCTTCRARILSGSVEMKQNFGLSESEIAAGYVLTCQAVPTSDEVTLSYDA